MVLRGKPVGEQGAADRWTAFACFGRDRARGEEIQYLFPFSVLEALPWLM
jgi:hypothetical protein